MVAQPHTTNEENIMSTPVVLITGALAGIGRATALAFARAGARLVVSGRNEEKGSALAVELRGLGAEVEFVPADVRHEEDVARLVDRAVERFGRLDVAVNNAGTEGKPGPITDQTAETYTATFDTNVLGTILCLKHEMRVMLAQKAGSIVNLSSTMGSRGVPGASMYVASKHAVEGLTKSAALEGAASGRNRNVASFRRQSRAVRGARGGRPVQTPRQARRDRGRDRLPRIGSSELSHRSDRRRQRRQDGAVSASGRPIPTGE
jgi:NAD(P)-dependent dehydrogenase (short-subunit alcohol dehydrogenase family)